MLNGITLPPKKTKTEEELRPPQTIEESGGDDNSSPINSPEAEFKAFADRVKQEVATLQKRNLFTKKEAWFALNALCLDFVGRCLDNELRDEAFKIVKYLVDTIPAVDELKDKELDSPFLLNMKMDNYISDRQDGRTLLPDEVK